MCFTNKKGENEIRQKIIIEIYDPWYVGEKYRSFMDTETGQILQVKNIVWFIKGK